LLRTWSRNGWQTVRGFLDGSLLSSYPGAFIPRLAGQENHTGLFGVLLGALGAFDIWRHRAKSMRPTLLLFLFCFWMCLGPALAGPLGAVPLYERLLWYRFVTFATFFWLLLAGWGLSVLWEYAAAPSRRAQRPLAVVFALGCALYCGSQLTTRSGRVLTESDLVDDRDSLAEVAGWLRANKESPGRVFSEFGVGINELVSVNYARHMLPVEAGVPSLCGWVYENTAVGAACVRTGLLHLSPYRIVDLSERMGVRYAVARSDGFKDALRDDPRWVSRLDSDEYSLFETVSVPSRLRADAGAVEVATYREEALPGGSYRVSARAMATDLTSFVVDVSHSRWWTATVNGKVRGTRESADGFLSIDLAGPVTGELEVELDWSVAGFMATGRWFSLLGLVFACGLYWFLRRQQGTTLVPWEGRLSKQALWSLAALTTIGVSARSWQVKPWRLAAGYVGGVVAEPTPGELDVGSFRDEENGGHTFVDAKGWGPRTSVGTHATRTWRSGRSEVLATLVKGVPATLTVRGTAEDPAFRVEVLDFEVGTRRCEVSGTLGRALSLPAHCAPEQARVEGALRRVVLRFHSANEARIHHVAVDAGIRYLNAESMENVGSDGGSDGLVFDGGTAQRPHNELMLSATVRRWTSPLRVEKLVQMPKPGRYELWARVMVRRVADTGSSGDIQFFAGDALVGEAETTHPERDWHGLEWQRIGVFTCQDCLVGVEVSRPQSAPDAVWAGVDVLALVPLP